MYSRLCCSISGVGLPVSWHIKITQRQQWVAYGIMELNVMFAEVSHVEGTPLAGLLLLYAHSFAAPANTRQMIWKPIKL